jgi:hypothetical protein
MSTRVKKVSEDSSQQICVTCEEKHFFTGKEPVLVVLADQHFPPSLPSSVGQCVVVMRCEDALLHELPGLLKEFFAGQDGQVMLPDGSAVLFGSLSHLATRGLDNYADEVVKTNRTITGLVSCQITVAHNIFVPLGGVCSEGLVRMMIDLDSWLQCGDVSVPYALTRSMERLWEQLLELGEDFSNCGGGDRMYFLPENPVSNRKIRFHSPALAVQIPKKIKPIPVEIENCIVECLVTEINNIFGFYLDAKPDLKRKHIVNVTVSGATRLIGIGGSHMKRLLSGPGLKNHTVVDLAVPGWKPDHSSVVKLQSQLHTIGINPSDTIIIDPLSNSAFCGTDADGAPEQMYRDSTGKYHCPGYLSVIT